MGMLLEIDVEKCKEFVIGEGRNEVLCTRILKASCGMLMASILCHNKIRKDIEAEGCKVNPHDVCVANKATKGKQHALMWRVDDVKALHVGSKVNDKNFKWAERKCGSDELVHATATCGKHMTIQE